MAERRLGRGLDFFLSSAAPEPETAPAAAGEAVQELPVVELIPNPHQPRREFREAELAELTASVRSSGVLQPILVRRVGERHQIVAGERRWRAAQAAGLATVPAIVREISDQQAAVFGLVENLHREDLNPIEKARAFKRLLELTRASQEELARQVGLDRSSLANFLRLLELPADLQAMVSRGDLTMGHAKALLAVRDEGARRVLAERIAREQLSVRQAEALAREPAGAAAADAGRAADPSPEERPTKKRPLWLKEIEDTLADVLDTPVSVRYGKKRATITIECLGRDEFERVYARLKGEPQD